MLSHIETIISVFKFSGIVKTHRAQKIEILTRILIKLFAFDHAVYQGISTPEEAVTLTGAIFAVALFQLSQ